MNRCENCGVGRTVKGRELTGRYCSPDCQIAHRRSLRGSAPYIIGFDIGCADTSVEAVLERKANGSTTIVSVAHHPAP